MPARERLRRATRWLAPSIAAASCATIAIGASDGIDAPIATIASIGFVALLAFPVLLGGSIAVRAVARGWELGALTTLAVEDGGGAPLLVGWIAVTALGLAAVAIAVF
ncbi:MAG TPA: hypothetical protein VGO00_06185, partial [Kofleriaceae bacterium]|nr:hypothetical protein [Kofleriaceae bacterium]